MNVKTSREEFDQLAARRHPQYVAALNRLARALVTKDQDAYEAAMKSLAFLSGNTMMLADLMGRRRVLLEVDAIRSVRRKFSAPSTTPVVPHVPAAEAIDDLLQREPRLARSAAEVAKVYQEHGFAVARSADLTLTKRIQDFIAGAMRDGSDVPSANEQIQALAGDEDTPGFTRAYSETIFRTTLNTAYTAGRVEMVKDPDIREVTPAFEFDAILDPDVRPNHKAAHGLIAAVDDPIWKIFTPPLGYNSFLPGTLVEGVFESASEARYSGPVAEIETDEGRRLSVTVNHPVLTPSGFVLAGDLREGDDLLVHGRHVEVLSPRSGNDRVPTPPVPRDCVHDQKMPARIEEVFQSALAKAAGPLAISRARGLTLDFHGHPLRYQGDVTIVRTDGLLPDDLKAGTTEPLQESDFVVASGATLPILEGCGVAVRARGVRLGAAADMDAPLYEARPKGASGDAVLAADLQLRNPGLVKRDRVRKVTIKVYDGHVYDLQSPIGLIVANGIIASNCRCDLRLVDEWELREKGLLTPDGKVYSFRPAGFRGAHPDPGFKPGP